MKYRLLQKVGTGGMAEVFHAVGEGPEGFERPFAIKRIHPRLSEAPEFSRMFVEEARISARLVHPNIVQVFDFVQQDGDYYIVMEPVDGVDMGRVFRRIARKQQSLSPLFCAEVARQVCRGLQFAHALTGADGQVGGVIHRDVTPPNIMLDWNGTVKIVDFGIARAMQDVRSQAAEPGTVRGKVSYVAPELLEGAVADARSDLFSLAVVMHELLSGQRLFLGENDLETLKQVRDLPIPPPSARNEAVKAALDEIVMRGLERNPAKRYQSAREMGDELEEFVMRRHFSMRALGDQARELFPAGTADDADDAAASGGHAHPPEAPSSIGQPDGVVVLDGASAAEQRRRSTPQLPLAALQPAATPPPPPPAAQAVVARPAGVSASGRILAPVPPPRGFRLSMGGSLALVAVSISAVLVALFVLVSVRRAGPSGAFAASGPGRDGVGAGNDPAGARYRTVHIALDSSPQGATVTLAGAAAGEQPVGPTPLVLPLARGDAPVELVLTKPGFAPLSFRVIPNRDKDATATLERETAPTAVALTATPSDDERRPKRRRSSRKARAEARAAAAAAAASGAAAAATSAAAGAAAAPARPGSGPAARDVALAPGSAPRR